MNKLVFNKLSKPSGSQSDRNEIDLEFSLTLNQSKSSSSFRQTDNIEKIIKLEHFYPIMSLSELEKSQKSSLNLKTKTKNSLKIKKGKKNNNKKKKSLFIDMREATSIIRSNSVSESISNTSNPKTRSWIFVFYKILLPLLCFTIFLYSFILMQKYIEDYCFYPSLCHCQNIFAFLYAIFREFLQSDSLLLAWFYFICSYLTNDYFHQKFLKVFFFSIQVVGLIWFYIYFYERKNETILGEIRIIRASMIFAITFCYTFILTLFYKEFSKIFLKKLAKIAIYTGYYFFHSFYLKNTFSFYLIEQFRMNMNYDMALNMFKIVLLIYYIFYQKIVNYYMMSFYSDILNGNSEISVDAIKISTKYVNVDALSVKILNILTIPLDEIYFWISFLNYLYSLISVYFNISLWETFYAKFYNKFNLKTLPTPKTKTIECLNYEKIESGCILEANILIFIRVLIYNYYHYFFYITKFRSLYSNCSLEESAQYLPFNFITTNMVTIFTSHTILIIIILCLMLKKKKVILSLIFEDISFLLRSIFLIIYYSQVDISIQFYILLQDAS